MSKLLFKKEFDCGLFEVYQDKPATDLVHVHQVHSNIVLPYKGKALDNQEVDGILFEREHKQISFAIKTADCLPVLLIGEKIALIHAGWKGLADGILTCPLIKNLHFKQAFIGPSIYDYEVQSEFRQSFPDSDYFYEKTGKLYFDLQGEAQKQLKNNYNGIKVSQSDICTFSHPDYNSFRLNKTKRRNWNLFTIN